MKQIWMKSLQRIQKNLETINSIGKTDNGMERLAFTEAEQQARQWFKERCIEEGMVVRTDPVGNVIARREGKREQAGAIAIGSHLDTVYNGGRFDGTIGVLAGLEIVHRLNRKKVMTDRPIEIIAFAAEESARFGMATIGSKAMAGLLDEGCTDRLLDKDGVSLGEAMNQLGYRGELLSKAARRKEELFAFLELHIEQGPELEQLGKQVGIATGIAAPVRLKVQVNGMAAHSGTTSMVRRQDALVAASKLVLAVEAAAKREKAYRTVATVGMLEVRSGAMNIVPGDVQFYVDIRSLDRASRLRVMRSLEDTVRCVEEENGVHVTLETISKEEPVLLDACVQQVLGNACETLGIQPNLMPSGAGHDAMNMAALCAAGLVFTPSRKGVSHHPEEYTEIADITRGVDVLEAAVLQLDHSGKERFADEAI